VLKVALKDMDRFGRLNNAIHAILHVLFANMQRILQLVSNASRITSSTIITHSALDALQEKHIIH